MEITFYCGICQREFKTLSHFNKRENPLCSPYLRGDGRALRFREVRKDRNGKWYLAKKTSIVIKHEKKRSKIAETQNCIDHFEDLMNEIKEQVEDAYDQAKEVLGSDNQSVRSADAYWRKQIPSIVDGDGSMDTMQETLNDMKQVLECLKNEE